MHLISVEDWNGRMALSLKAMVILYFKKYFPENLENTTEDFQNFY